MDKLKELIWSFLAIWQFAYLLMRGKIEQAEANRMVEELKRRYAENKAEVEKANSGKSPDDVINEHLKS